MGKQKSSESTSFSGSGQAWAKPFAKEAAGMATGVYRANAPNLTRLSGNANTIADQLQTKFGAGEAGAGVARRHFMDTIAGGPQSNPFLDQILGRTRSNVSDEVNSQFAGAGRYGSGMHTGVLTDRLADAENSLRYQDFTGQQGRMDQAAQALTGANQGEAAQALGGLGVAAELPYTGTNALANQLSALFSGGQSRSVQYSPNPLWGAVGAGLGAAGAYFSDRRLKKDIERVGEFKDGLGIYTFRYRNDPDGQVFKGVMADEVRALRPQAYIPNYRGTPFDGVNYAAL